MNDSRKNTLRLLAAAAFVSFGAPASGQGVETPFSPDETGVTPTSDEQAAVAYGARGGTRAPDLGGTVVGTGGSDAGRQSVFPDSDTETNRIDD